MSQRNISKSEMISKLGPMAKSKNDVISISETIRTVFDEPSFQTRVNMEIFRGNYIFFKDV